MSNLKNELSLVTSIPAAPATVRAQPVHISADPNGRIAYGSANVVLVRDMANPSFLIVCSRHTSPVTCARISPNGQFVASGDRDGNLIIWANTPETSEKYRGAKLISGPVRDIAWTEDSERLVVVGEGKVDNGAVISFSGSSIGSMTGHINNIVSCDMKKTRPFRIFTGGADTKCSYFEGPPFKYVHSSAEFKGTVNCVRVAPNGELAAAVSGANDIVLFTTADGKKVRSIPTDHTGSVLSVAWSPDSLTIATAGADKTVKVFSVADGTQLRSTSLGKTIPAMQQGVWFNAAGQLASVAFSGAIHFISESGEVKQTWMGHQKNVVGMSLHNASNTVLSAATDGVVLHWTPSGAGQYVGTQVPLDTDIVSAFAPVGDGSKVAIVAGANLVLVDVLKPSDPVTVVTKDANFGTALGVLQSGAQFAVLRNATVTIFSNAGAKQKEEKIAGSTRLAAYGGLLAVGGEKFVKLYRVCPTTGALDLTHTLVGPHATSNVTSLAFSADGTRLASGDSTKSIGVWCVETGKLLYDDLVYHTSSVASLYFADLNTLVSGSNDCAVIVWDLDGKKRKMQDYAHRSGVMAVAAGPGGSVLSAGGDYCIRQWNV